MKDKIISAIRRYNMLNSGDDVLAAVSGGADSMAMLKALNDISKDIGIKVRAAHLNHNLRGSESSRDCEFVRVFCLENNIPLEIGSINVSENRKKGESIETAARRVRYDFLHKAARGAKIATAHTLTDSAETVIMNLIRGTTLNGLCGIAPVRDDIIRPLIEVTREDTEEFCRENGISFVTDSTNLSDDYRRNNIRHNIMPMLTEINPSFYESVKRMLRSNIAENGYLGKKAEMLLKSAEINGGYDAKTLKDADEAIRNRAVALILRQSGNDSVRNRFVDEINSVIINGGRTGIAGGVIVRQRNGVLELVSESPKEEISLFLSERNIFFDKIIKTEIISKEKYEELLKVNKMLAKESLDFDKIGENPQLRSKADGDKIRLYKRGVTKTLKKLFNEANIPPEKRGRIAVVSDENGILWIEGFGSAERCAVTDKTVSVMHIAVCDYEKE